MTVYTPKEIDGNVNVSKVSALKENLLIILKFVFVLFIIYLSLGVLDDFLVPRVSVSLEEKMGKLFLNKWNSSNENIEKEAKIQSLLNDFKNYGPLENRNYQVHIIQSEEVNALALPGGHIIIFGGLLSEVRSENELVMVLAHELGHFANRDHLRGFSRGLVFLMMSVIFLGTENTISKMIGDSMSVMDTKFSQKQELAADALALELLFKKYGHVGGATDFFERAMEKEKLGRIFYLFATHPYPQERVQALKKMIKLRQYQINAKAALNI